VEKMSFSLKTSKQNTVSRLDVQSEVSQRTYGPEPKCTIESVTRNFIFTSLPIALISLF
jgi:hypothetical protein